MNEKFLYYASNFSETKLFKKCETFILEHELSIENILLYLKELDLKH